MSSNGVSAKDLLKQERSVGCQSIPTFVQPLDEILGGGIKPGVITEIVGDCGVGKTTMCYQLCIDVQIPRVLQGLEAQSLFIDTENSFVVQRVKEMAKAFAVHCNSIIPKGCGTKVSEHRVMSNIHVVQCLNLSDFENVILALDEYVSRNVKMKLIVIDSIAFPFYSENDGFLERGKPLYSIGQVLHYIAVKYDIAVVITNNITTRFDQSGNEFYVPFLGDSWNHIANQRISLYWSNQGQSRVAEILKSSFRPLAAVNYRITGLGVRE